MLTLRQPSFNNAPTHNNTNTTFDPQTIAHYKLKYATTRPDNKRTPTESTKAIKPATKKPIGDSDKEETTEQGPRNKQTPPKPELSRERKMLEQFSIRRADRPVAPLNTTETNKGQPAKLKPVVAQNPKSSSPTPVIPKKKSVNLYPVPTKPNEFSTTKSTPPNGTQTTRKAIKTTPTKVNSNGNLVNPAVHGPKTSPIINDNGATMGTKSPVPKVSTLAPKGLSVTTKPSTLKVISMSQATSTQSKIRSKSPKPPTTNPLTSLPAKPLLSKPPSLPAKSPIPPKTAPKSPQTMPIKRKLSTPTGPIAKKPKRDIEDDYDYEDGFVLKDSSDYLPLGNLLREIGYTRGPTSVDVYNCLDPHYNPSKATRHNMVDDDDDCMEVNSFVDHCEMDAKTAKRGIEEDKREREKEKRQKKLQDQKKDNSTKTAIGRSTINKSAALPPLKVKPSNNKEWLD